LKQVINATNLKRWIEPPTSPSKTSPTKSTPSPSKVVDISSDGNSPVVRPSLLRIPELQLTQAERCDLLACEWTNDKLVDAVNKLLAAHVSTDLAQSSVLAQSSFAAVRSDTIQIFYDTNNWVATAFVEDEIYVANSQPTTSHRWFRNNLKNCMYRHRVSATGSLAVNMVQCSQQRNYKDCASFASAFLGIE